MKNRFLNKEIRAPIHLSRGNEDALLKIFEQVSPEDWVFSTHRSHYHALLHGLSPDWVREEILQGRSMHIFNRERRFFSSAIVAGCLPIAVGVALGIKCKGEKNHVWVFIGDMAAETGAFHECTRYAAGHSLPITFVVEDNGLSTNTPTQEVWGEDKGRAHVIRYQYVRQFPHVGCDQWVTF
ncbi:MAG TPA: thiamine pyrophosphate-dependent enzyme [Dehalococcoidales bacterium]|nr:thiamine pyrophosphate-dependent enzyme [Dehalococcoidales bacterium]